jgi:hypothetical protein
MGSSACYHGVTGGCAVCQGLDRRRRAAEADRTGAARSRSDAEWTAVLQAASRQELAELADERAAESATRQRIALVLERSTGPASVWGRWSRRRRGNWTA